MSRAVSLVWGGTVILMILASPWAPEIASRLWDCSFRELTGFACPTCGSARAAMLLADFEVVEAIARYPLPALAWIVFVIGGLSALALTAMGRSLPSPPRSLPLWVRAAFVLAILANWAYSIATGV